MRRRLDREEGWRIRGVSPTVERLTLVMAIAFGGCSSGTNGDSPAQDSGQTSSDGATADSASDTGTPITGEGCDAFAGAMCDFYEHCMPISYRGSLGARDRCITIETGRCKKSLGASGSHATTTGWTECAKAIHDGGCQGGFILPVACLPLGDLANGAACAHGAQCSSGVCAANGKCGVCVTPSGPVLTYGDVDAPCGPSAACKYGLECKAGKCRPQAGLGESCADRTCDPTQGVECDASKICSPSKIAHAGEPCAEVGTRCVDYTRCDGTTCKPRPEIGGACGADFECATDVACLPGGLGSKCGQVDPASCK